MTRKERRDYILALDKVVKRWVRNSRLFSGGCCFSAGQIAKLLEAKGIRYQVICWESGSLKEKHLKEIVINNNCCHVGIQVSLDGKKFIIGGGDFSLLNLFATYVNTYKNMRSKEIIECDELGVEAKTWNRRYNRKLNSRFVRSLNNAVSK
jgi:hypothetical protein